VAWWAGVLRLWIAEPEQGSCLAGDGFIGSWALAQRFLSVPSPAADAYFRF
jgi:hypothetical protein